MSIRAWGQKKQTGNACQRSSLGRWASIRYFEGREVIALGLEGDVQQRMSGICITAFEFVWDTFRETSVVSGSFPPFDEDIVIARRSAFSQGAADKLKRAILLGNTHDAGLVHGVAALPAEKDGSPRRRGAVAR